MTARTVLGGFCALLMVGTSAFAQPDILWSRTFGGGGKDVCNSVRQTTDGGYILGGYTESYGVGPCSLWLVKADVNGTREWSCTFGGSDWEMCRSVQQITDGGYVLGGLTSSYGAGGWDFWLVKTGPDPVAAEPIISPLPDKYALHQNYPNPFNPSTQISYDLTRAGHLSLKVFDLLGREVATLVDEVRPAGTRSVTFDGSELASGIYFYHLQASGFTTTKKMVLMK